MWDACDCAPASADLFSPILKQTAVLNRSTLDIFPTGEIGYGPLDFLVPASDEHYYNLKDSRLHVSFKVTKKDGTDLAADSAVSVANFALHSLFSQVDVWINEELITVSTNTYPYTAYMQTLATYSKAAMETQLAGELNAPDTPSKFDALTGDNKGFLERKKAIAESRQCDLSGALHIDLFNQDRFLISKCNFRIRLTPSHQNFFLLAAAADTFAVKIVGARFEVAKLEMAPALLLEHARMIKTQPAVYPIRRTEIKTFSVPTGSSSVVREALFTGQMPRTLMVGIVSSTAFGGSINKNPYNFEHAGLNFLCIYVDNIRYPTRPIQPDYGGKNYLDAYHSFLSNSGLWDEDRDISVTPEQFAGGSALYIIRLTPSDPDSIVTEIRRNGSLRLEAKFAAALTKTMTFVVLATFDNVIEITESRNLMKDY